MSPVIRLSKLVQHLSGGENDRCRQVIEAVACCVKVKIPNTLAHGLDDLLDRCGLAVQRMLAHRDWSSSKHYSDLVPCVVSKSLISKYQKNPKCKQVKLCPSRR